MADTKYKFDYIPPENVNCEVPGQQKIREDFDSAYNDISLEANNIENPEDYVLSPVVTITTNEATLTKGDMKLHKVSVTENVSDMKNGIYHTVKPDSYPPIHSDVPALQTLRMEPEERRTRIPTRFKNAVNRVRREKSVPNRSEGESSRPNYARRSSIPRLKTKPRPDSPKPEEDEFDKIYDEIVDSSIDIDVSLLNNKVDDPVKVEDRFEEIIHDYDEGRVKPINVEEVVGNKNTVVNTNPFIDTTENVKKTETSNASTNPFIDATDKSKKAENVATPVVPKETGQKATSTTNIVKPKVTTQTDTSINALKPKDTTHTESSLNVEKPKSVEKSTTAEKPKSRIPMLKRKSEPEIEVPKNLTAAAKAKPANDKLKIQSLLASFPKNDETKVRKLPTRATMHKKENADVNNAKEDSKNVKKDFKNGEKHEVQYENVEVQGSFESDIGAENIIKIDDVSEKPTKYSEKVDTIKIVQMTPAIETVNTSSEYVDTTIKPSVIKIIEAPPTAPVVENTNHQILFEEVPVHNSTIIEAVIQPKQDIGNIEQQEYKVTPIKIISKEEFEKITQEHAKNVPIEKTVLPIETVTLEPISIDPVENYDDINNNSNTFASNNNNDGARMHVENKEISIEGNKVSDNTEYEDTPVLKGKVSSIIKRLGSREDKEEIKKEAVEDLPKPKSVLSKIAMFERQEPADTKPKPARVEQKPHFRVENDPTDFKPKIINEVLKPVPRTLDLNDNYTNDHNQMNAGPNNGVKTEKFAVVNVKDTAVSKFILADEATTEDAAVVSEIEPYSYNTLDSVPKVENNYEELKAVEQEINLEPIEIEYVDLSKTPDEFEPKPFESRNEDVVFINHANNTVQYDNILRREEQLDNALKRHHRISQKIQDFDDDFNTYQMKQKEHKEETKSPFDYTPKDKSHKVKNYFGSQPNAARKETPKSPFDFTPKDYSNRVRNYDEYKSNESPSLDYLDRPSRYKCRTDEPNLKKAKSVAELDLGEAVKGRVHEMIVRMKSVDRSAVEKREVINSKERPRKKSVSEKIALFEGKLSVSATHHSSRLIKPAQKVEEHKMSPEELKKKIADLSAAKLKYGSMANMSYVMLNDGRQMPVLAIGTALIDKELTPHVIAAAIDLGYRAIDAAWVYGNEREVGEGIRAKIEDGTVKREDLFIVNKLWSTFHRQDLVAEACRRSLDAMGLDYFDLYLVHNPMSFKEGLDPLPKIASVIQYSKHDYLDAWYGMEELAARGWVRSVGVSNFNAAQVQRVVDRARVKPVVNMVECHPYLSQQRLDDFCAERDIKLFTFGVLGSKGTPAALKGSSAAAIDDPLLQVMAAGLGVSPAQLLVRFQIESGHAVVTKASSGAHLWDNLQALTFRLSEGQLDAIRALNRNKRTFTFKGMGDTHKNYPFNAPF